MTERTDYAAVWFLTVFRSFRSSPMSRLDVSPAREMITNSRKPHTLLIFDITLDVWSSRLSSLKLPDEISDIRRGGQRIGEAMEVLISVDRIGTGCDGPLSITLWTRVRVTREQGNRRVVNREAPGTTTGAGSRGSKRRHTEGKLKRMTNRHGESEVILSADVGTKIFKIFGFRQSILRNGIMHHLYLETRSKRPY